MITGDEPRSGPKRQPDTDTDTDSGSDGPALWSIRRALATTLAIVGSVGLALIGASWLLLRPDLGTAKLPEFLESVKILLGIVAGIGGVVALVVAYRRQKVPEYAEQRADVAQRRSDEGEQRERTRLLNERFKDAAAQLGDNNPTVRLAGGYAMANLADDWHERGRRQMCIDVLCSYLRMPVEPEPAADAEPTAQAAWTAFREVRHTILRIIAAHLRQHNGGQVPTWQGHDFDLTGITVDIDRLDLTGAQFPAGHISFHNAQFTRGQVEFDGATFLGGHVDFTGAKFAGGFLSFAGAEFSSGLMDFSRAEFASGYVGFHTAKFVGGIVAFLQAQFSGGTVDFTDAELSSGRVDFFLAEFPSAMLNFTGTRFTGGEVNFIDVEITDGYISFPRAEVHDGLLNFHGAKFTGGHVRFPTVTFTGGAVGFSDAEFSGGDIDFSGAQFSGGTVDFSAVKRWEHPPNGLPTSASGLHLPNPQDTGCGADS